MNLFVKRNSYIQQPYCKINRAFVKIFDVKNSSLRMFRNIYRHSFVKNVTSSSLAISQLQRKIFINNYEIMCTIYKMIFVKIVLACANDWA